MSMNVFEKSPMRILERALAGGLGRGRFGVVLARTGVGKTGFLMTMALDRLLQGRKVMHISTARRWSTCGPTTISCCRPWPSSSPSTT